MGGGGGSPNVREVGIKPDQTCMVETHHRISSLTLLHTVCINNSKTMKTVTFFPTAFEVPALKHHINILTQDIKLLSWVTTFILLTTPALYPSAVKVPRTHPLWLDAGAQMKFKLLIYSLIGFKS